MRGEEKDHVLPHGLRNFFQLVADQLRERLGQELVGAPAVDDAPLQFALTIITLRNTDLSLD